VRRPSVLPSHRSAKLFRVLERHSGGPLRYDTIRYPPATYQLARVRTMQGRLECRLMIGVNEPLFLPDPSMYEAGQMHGAYSQRQKREGRKKKHRWCAVHVPSTIRSVQGLSATISTPSSSRCPRACNATHTCETTIQSTRSLSLFSAIAAYSILLVQKKCILFST